VKNQLRDISPELIIDIPSERKHRLRQLYQEYVDLNKAANDRIIKDCPKCGIEHPEPRRGKQRKAYA